MLRKFHVTGLTVLAATVLALPPAASAATDFGPQPGDNAVLKWNQALLQAIRETKPGPTIVARSIAVLHTAIFDAWAAYDDHAVPTRPHRDWRRPEAERTDANRAVALSFAAYRTLTDLFPAQSTEFDALMDSLGDDRTDVSLDPGTPAGVGNSAADAVLRFRHEDGSNQLGDLHPGAYSDYTGYAPVNPPEPAEVVDPNRWQPLEVSDGNGGSVIQKCTTPQWARVIPFALNRADQFRPPAPAQFGSSEYVSQAQELITLSAGLTDVQKATAEYFADGPSSEFPPGHWCLFAEFVSRRDAHSLGDDVKLFFALGNALFDSSISAWDAKMTYDSVRPVTAIHYLFSVGVLGTIEAWGGPCEGTRTIPASQWRPYQLATVVTPPFPEYFSGHSIFSAAGAEILHSFTGSDALGASATIKAGTFRGEPGCGPASDVTLSWATFSDAANAAGMSRRWGGIHFQQADLEGRAIGREVGALVWQKAQGYFDGTASSLDVSAVSSPAPVAVPPRR
ncbi:MAG: vanadium-dependent haloperoxidase [Thermoanaerobaculia bacterium]